MRSSPTVALLCFVSAMLPLSTFDAAPAEALWTDRPVRVDRNRQQFERIPAETGTASATAPQVHYIEIGRDLKVVDAANFSTSGIVYRVVGIAGLKPNEICRDERGHRWACGVRSRATLRSLLQRRNLAARCTVEKADASPVEVACIYSNQNLADYLVARGLAVRVP